MLRRRFNRLLARTGSMALKFWLLLLWVIYANTAASAQHSQNNALPPLVMQQANVFYNLTNLTNASGFFAAPQNSQLQDLQQNALPAAADTTLQPKFKPHRRQWLYTHIQNDTSVSRWVMHISHFFINKIEILVSDEDGSRQLLQFSSNNTQEVFLNVIGRGFELELLPGKRYLLAVELNSNINTMPPYIALASYEHYQFWAKRLDLFFTSAAGSILAFIFLALLAFALLKDATFFWFASCSLTLLSFYLRRTNLPSDFFADPYTSGYGLWLQVSLMCFSLAMFAANFLQINKHSGRLYQGFIFTLGIIIAVFLMGPWVSRDVNIILHSAAAAVLLVFVVSSGLLKLGSDGTFYLLYIVGWLPVVISTGEFIVFVFMGNFPAVQTEVSYKPIRELYFQIAHILIISLALIIRNQSIHEKKLAAEFLSRAKSRFIAASQKDMQAPLNSLRSDLKSLAGHVASPISRQLINSLNQLVDEVGHNLGSINYFNKLEGGITQINIQPVKLSSLFTKLQREYDLQATKNLTRLTVRHANIEVFSDSLLLERMLRNLISNAIKFSPGGRVLVGCRYKQGRVVIQVLDNGCGIAAADQKRIFNEYRRVAENALAVEGSGIGLSIVKYLSTLLDHPIMLESSLGKGSVFSITLPRVATRKLPAHLSALALNRPQIALCIADATLKQYVKKRLLEWRYLVSDFNSLHEIHFNTSNVAGTKKVVISDLEMLMPHTLQPEFRQQLKNLSADLSAAAFLCDKSVTVPAILQKAGWLPLPLPLNSTQLITFLNYVSQQNSA